jgi:hypothetical protein
VEDVQNRFVCENFVHTHIRSIVIVSSYQDQLTTSFNFISYKFKPEYCLYIVSLRDFHTGKFLCIAKIYPYEKNGTLLRVPWNRLFKSFVFLKNGPYKHMRWIRGLRIFLLIKTQIIPFHPASHLWKIRCRFIVYSMKTQWKNHDMI